VNGDGRVELISGSYSPGDLYLFRLSGGKVQPGKPIAEPESRDGVLTVASRMKVSLGGKKLTSTEAARLASAASFADWDGDGRADLLVGNMLGEVHWARNRGGPGALSLGKRTPILAAGVPICLAQDTHPVATDWDGDGAMDLLVGCDDGTVTFYKGKGRPATLAAGVLIEIDGKALKLGTRVKLAVVDWNRDGKMDLLLGNVERTTEAGPVRYGGNVFVALRR
jgi:hypothetical protein